MFAVSKIIKVKEQTEQLSPLRIWQNKKWSINKVDIVRKENTVKHFLNERNYFLISITGKLIIKS